MSFNAKSSYWDVLSSKPATRQTESVLVALDRHYLISCWNEAKRICWKYSISSNVSNNGAGLWIDCSVGCEVRIYLSLNFIK